MIYMWKFLTEIENSFIVSFNNTIITQKSTFNTQKFIKASYWSETSWKILIIRKLNDSLIYGKLSFSTPWDKNT